MSSDVAITIKLERHANVRKGIQLPQQLFTTVWIHEDWNNLPMRTASDSQWSVLMFADLSTNWPKVKWTFGRWTCDTFTVRWEALAVELHKVGLLYITQQRRLNRNTGNESMCHWIYDENRKHSLRSYSVPLSVRCGLSDVSVCEFIRICI